MTDNQPVRVADWIMATLVERGITQAFMVTVGGAMHLDDAAGMQPALTITPTLHEQAAAIASEAYCKVSGRPALCLVTTGPGGTNAITGVTGAWLDSVPMLVLSGQVKRPDLVGDSKVRQRGVQEVDTVSLIRSITKYSALVMEPERIRYHLERALFFAENGRPGPVWLDIPLDVQAALIDPTDLESFDPDELAQTQLSDAEVRATAEQIIEMIRSAKRPMLLFGAGVRRSCAEGAALQLAEVLGIPVLCTWPAQGIVGDDHPLFFGRPGSLAPRYANFILQNADVMVAIGTRLDLASTGYDYNDFGRVARKVVIDIDSNELAKLKDSIELGVNVDAGRAINAMLESLQFGAEPVWVDTASWMSQCVIWRNRYPLVQVEKRQASDRISTYEFADALSEILSPEDVIAPGCSGLALEIFLLALRLKTGQRVICNYALGAMGYGPPTALGASLGSGGKRTICVDGDGGLQLNVQELETIRRLNLPIKLFILENEGYASIRASQNRWFGHVFAADPSSGLTLPRLEFLAAAYGLQYRKITADSPIIPQLKEVLETRGPVLCEVPTPLDERREPSQTSEALSDGTMRSRAIEDLAPLLDRDELAANLLPKLD